MSLPLCETTIRDINNVEHCLKPRTRAEPTAADSRLVGGCAAGVHPMDLSVRATDDDRCTGDLGLQRSHAIRARSGAIARAACGNHLPETNRVARLR